MLNVLCVASVNNIFTGVPFLFFSSFPFFRRGPFTSHIPLTIRISPSSSDIVCHPNPIPTLSSKVIFGISFFLGTISWYCLTHFGIPTFFPFFFDNGWSKSLSNVKACGCPSLGQNYKPFENPPFPLISVVICEQPLDCRLVEVMKNESALIIIVVPIKRHILVPEKIDLEIPILCVPVYQCKSIEKINH